MVHAEDVEDCLTVCVASLHRLPVSWFQRHELFKVEVRYVCASSLARATEVFLVLSRVPSHGGGLTGFTVLRRHPELSHHQHRDEPLTAGPQSLV